jgi:hypothetical protein
MSRAICMGIVMGALAALPACGAATSQAAFPDSTRPLSVEPGAALEGGASELDEHGLALLRQLQEPWHRRADKDEQLLVPLVDAEKWKRVRFWLVDHFTGFRYGDDFHALNVVFVHDVEPGAKLTPSYCMKNAERWARPQLRAFDVRMGPIQSRSVQWKHTEIPVRVADAVVDYGTGPAQFSAAWAAYPAYTDACLVFAFAVPWGDHRELAGQVRDRWIEEGVKRIKPLTEARPHRLED